MPTDPGEMHSLGEGGDSRNAHFTLVVSIRKDTESIINDEKIPPPSCPLSLFYGVY